MLDPNTGQPIDPKRKDLGHKPGQEWRTRKEMHKNNGSSRREVIDSENNPDLYQWEDRSSNRSRKHKKINNSKMSKETVKLLLNGDEEAALLNLDMLDKDGRSPLFYGLLLDNTGLLNRLIQV